MEPKDFEGLREEAFGEIEDVEERSDTEDVVGNLGSVRLFTDAPTAERDEARAEAGTGRREAFEAGCIRGSRGDWKFLTKKKQEHAIAEYVEQRAESAKKSVGG